MLFQLGNPCRPGPKTSNGVSLVSREDITVTESLRQQNPPDTHGETISSAGRTTKPILEYVST